MKKLILTLGATALLSMAVSASDFKTYIDVSGSSTKLGKYTDTMTMRPSEEISGKSLKGVAVTYGLETRSPDDKLDYRVGLTIMTEKLDGRKDEQGNDISENVNSFGLSFHVATKKYNGVRFYADGGAYGGYISDKGENLYTSSSANTVTQVMSTDPKNDFLGHGGDVMQVKKNSSVFQVRYGIGATVSLTKKLEVDLGIQTGMINVTTEFRLKGSPKVYNVVDSGVRTVSGKVGMKYSF